MKVQTLLWIQKLVIALTYLPERYNEALIKKTALSMKEKKDVLEA